MKSRVENIAQMHDAAAEAAGLLKALANPDRLLILCHLADGEKNVGELQDLLGLRQPAISQQLSRLRFEKLVESRRSGKTIYYRLCSAEVAQVIGLLYELYCAPTSGRRRSPGKQGRRKKRRSLAASMGAART
jgi:ArsR family transcriptional regulator